MLGSEPTEPTEEPAPEYGDELDEEFRSGILEAFPELSDAQVAALKVAIQACVDSKSSKPGEKAKPAGGKPPSGLALVFGKGK